MRFNLASFTLLAAAVAGTTSAASTGKVTNLDQKGVTLRVAKSSGGNKVPVQTTSWCVKLISACQKTCLHKQKGQQEVKFACERDEKAKEYLFGCHCNGHDRTNQALKSLSGDPAKHVVRPITKIVTTKTRYSTSYVNPIEYTEVDTAIAYAYSDALETTTSTNTLTVSPDTTYANTRTTVTSTPLTIKVVKTTFKSTTTRTSFTTTVSEVPAQTQRFEEIQAKKVLNIAVSKPNADSSARTSTFCAAYERSCKRRCTKVKSQISEETCAKTKDGKQHDEYNLFCGCKDGSVQTQHALNDVPSDDPNKTRKVTIAGTSTVYSTVVKTRTNTAHLSTITSSITTTSTVLLANYVTTTITAVEQTTETAAQGTETVVLVSTKTKTAPTSTITSFKGPTHVKSPIATTTMTMLAPMGRIRLDDKDTNAVDGWIGVNQDSRRYIWANPDESKALDIALVQAPQDGPNGPVYAMLDVTNNRWIFGEYGGGTTNSDYPDDLAEGLENYWDCRYTEFIRYRHTVPSPEQAYDQYYLYPFKAPFAPEPNSNDPQKSFQLQLQGRFMYDGTEYDIGVTGAINGHIRYLGLYSAHTTCFYPYTYKDYNVYYEPNVDDLPSDD